MTLLMPRRPMPGCRSVACPECGLAAPCVDHCEVDVGVGVQTFDHEYECPEHGAFAFVLADSPTDFSAPGRHVWRDW